MHVLRLLLFPLTPIYALIVWTRNRLYDWGVLTSKSFDIPRIVIGNLAVGGTGKSPMTEYVLKLVQDQFKVATLSRGYGRKTRGFRYVEPNSSAVEVGDEPLQFKKKFPKITVAVSEDRCFGIAQLQAEHNLILLDDAFQHRKLKPSFSILLFDYNSCLKPLLLLPTGSYRDLLQESRRASFLIITKTPSSASVDEKKRIHAKITQYNKSAFFAFSSIKYGTLKALYTHTEKKVPLRNKTILLLTGIANPAPLKSYLIESGAEIDHLAFPDHYAFSLADIQSLRDRYHNIPLSNKIIITTEKDAQRLSQECFASLLGALPIFYIPIEAAFSPEDEPMLQHNILKEIKIASR